MNWISETESGKRIHGEGSLERLTLADVDIPTVVLIVEPEEFLINVSDVEQAFNSASNLCIQWYRS